MKTDVHGSFRAVAKRRFTNRAVLEPMTADAGTGLRLLRANKFALLACVVWLTLPKLSQAQLAEVGEQPPAVAAELDVLQTRLDEQAAEINWLRARVAELAPEPDRVLRLPALEASTDSDPAESTGQPQFVSANSAELTSLVKRLEALEAAKAKSEPAKTKDGWIDVSNEKWTVKLGGHVQADFIHWAHADSPPIPASDYFEFRRLRLVADGTGYGVYDFRLQIDIEPEGEDTVTTPVTVVKDAYLTMHELPLIDRIRFGNFFVPFSLEQVTNDTNNIFMERSIPTTGVFSADREVGAAFYGVNDSQSATFSFGAFIDGISEALKERIDDNQGYRLAGRATWVPYYDEASNGRYLFHVGGGLLYTDDQDNTVRFRARPQVHEGPFLIDSGNRSADSFTSANLELATVWGPWSVQSELFLTTVDLATGSRADLYGAYVYLSYFLTGENRIYERYGQHSSQFARNVPISNFFVVPGGAGPGAWELKSRISYLDLDELTAGRYNDLTVGVNWYWTERIRWMFDWIHPVTSAATPFGNRESDLLAMRFDFNW